MYSQKLVNEMGAHGSPLGASDCWKLVGESSRVKTILHDHEIFFKNIHLPPSADPVT